MESSTRMGCGRSPCRLDEHDRAWVQAAWGPYVDDGVLALDGDAEVGACELHVQVAALVLSVDGDGHVQVLDGLGPLVGKGGLLGILSRLGLGIELLLLVGGGFGHVWCAWRRAIVYCTKYLSCLVGYAATWGRPSRVSRR